MSQGTVALIGTGVIGASWATHFLARGLRVVASDPAPDAENALRRTVAEQWSVAARLGLSDGAGQDNLTFVADPQDAAARADFVQESGPERLELKRSLFRLLDEAARPEVVLASSSSGLTVSSFQDVCGHPERVIVGHPFNPPHLIPLVEVVGGRLTSAQVVEATLQFYRAAGKRPIHVKKEIKGHVANRLQAALWREAFGLVDAGIASVEDIDIAIEHGPGLRWALLGPFLNIHLSGGAGGLQHLLAHIGPSIDAWWTTLFATRLTEKVQAAVIDGTAQETEGWDMTAMKRERDELLVDLLQRKANARHLP
jgi:3-hydroxyacyl-CoA dehydrogenase